MTLLEKFASVRKIRVACLLGIAAVLWLGAALPENEIHIDRLSLESSNLLIHVQAPPGTAAVTLQAKGLTADSAWQDLSTQSVHGGEALFRLPKPDDMRIFRVQAASTPPRSSPLHGSSEIRYVNATPMNTASQMRAARKPSNRKPPAFKEMVLHFKAQIDGSDRIRISHSGAIWEHVNWNMPNQEISINGIPWKPAQNNIFALPGDADLLPAGVDLSAFQLERIEGRDTVVCESDHDGLVVYVDDSPFGAGRYEFKLRFPAGAKPAKQKAGAQAARLRIKARIDGSDRLVITPTNATWEHKFFSWPAEVSLNGINWAPVIHPILANDGATRFLPSNVDFTTARCISRQGRDLAAIEPKEDSLIVYFVDNPNGSDLYQLEIVFAERH